MITETEALNRFCEEVRKHLSGNDVSVKFEAILDNIDALIVACRTDNGKQIKAVIGVCRQDAVDDTKNQRFAITAAKHSQRSLEWIIKTQNIS